MNDQADIEELARAARGMRRSLRVPAFIALLATSSACAAFLLLTGNGILSLPVLVSAVTALLSVFVLLTVYTGGRGFSAPRRTKPADPHSDE